jgi:hypothetical protein
MSSAGRTNQVTPVLFSAAKDCGFSHRPCAWRTLMRYGRRPADRVEAPTLRMPGDVLTSPPGGHGENRRLDAV